MFAQVLGQLERISQELMPRALEGRRAAELFNDAARAERLCAAVKARLARRVEETTVIGTSSRPDGDSRPATPRI